ncbi:NAD(P)/FAD-dependent oxidoreductase [Marinobacter sp. BGYM27]|uniref:phytoene desaturase family protein n=1 Tax=Marinobacter sp. BGYM27 TaxID=2975597 RepID=UPI0021A3EA04|nr:NAD(P)/FAD-dependent oxidoreductase [Marinobacter sp. BGYM27]MDG5499985.1 NAD(P)/FAD-dependent oxidoreductase [Marinobacter sp. BGYM27]
MTTSTPEKNTSAGLKPSTIRIGRRYRASRIDDDYDAIVIGSGIGGLTTAACLSKAGKKVLVLEQHYTAGGFTHSYARNGYEWDVGVHYIGDMGSPNTLARKLFDYITDGQLKWAPMDETYDRFYLGDKIVNLKAGKEQFRASLVEAFPEEEKAIDAYIRLLGKVSSGMQIYTMSKLAPTMTAPLVGKAVSLALPRYFNQTTYEVLSGLTNNEALIGAITGQWGDCGVTPKQSSFLIHALIAKHYVHGGYYPVGGASEMANTIIPVIQQGGGDVFTYADVTNILVENGRACGVRMADGHEIRSELIISNAGVLNTFETLLPEAAVRKSGYPRTRQTIQPSMSHIGLYIGFKGTAAELGLPKTNFWIYPDEHHDRNVERFLDNTDSEFPVVYISFPSAKDPSYLNRYPDTATVEIVAPTTYDMFAQWKDDTWGKRGEEYEQLKQVVTDRLLEKLYEKLPQLRGKVDYVEASTPLSTDWFCRYSRGEIYGLDHTPERFDQTWLRPKTRIPGLYLTGQDILTCGVVGAMIGGLVTTLSIQGVKGAGLAKRIFVDKAGTTQAEPGLV